MRFHSENRESGALNPGRVTSGRGLEQIASLRCSARSQKVKRDKV